MIRLLLISMLAFAADRSDVVDTGEGRYDVTFSAEHVDVTRLDPGAAAPAAVKLKLHRKNKRPVELRLHTLEAPDQPIRYEGDLRQWKDQSVVGFELAVSFDKKTWKSVKKFFGAAH